MEPQNSDTKLKNNLKVIEGGKSKSPKFKLSGRFAILAYLLEILYTMKSHPIINDNTNLLPPKNNSDDDLDYLKIHYKIEDEWGIILLEIERQEYATSRGGGDGNDDPNNPYDPILEWIVRIWGKKLQNLFGKGHLAATNLHWTQFTPLNI